MSSACSPRQSLDYVAAQYLTYTHILEQMHVQPERYSFLDYIRQICEGMAFRDSHTDKLGSPLGAWGYFFKLLEMVGYAAGSHGAVGDGVRDALLQEMPEVPQGIPHRPPPLVQFVVEREAVGQEGSPEGVARGCGRVDRPRQQVAAPLAAAPLAGTEAAIAALEPVCPEGCRRAVTFTLKKCPSCEAHHVAITLHTHSVDKRPVVKSVAKFDKTEVEKTHRGR